MRTFASRLLSFVLACAPALAAQDPTLLASDFEPGSIGGWLLAAAGPHAWGFAGAGVCGATSGALVYQRAAGCDYAVGGPSSSSFASPLFAPSTTEIVVEFDYRISVDPSGDIPLVTLQSPGAAAIVVADLSNLVNDGELRHLRVTCSLPAVFISHRLAFTFAHDNAGNLGQGLLFDNLLVREAPAAVVFCDGVAGCPCGNPGDAQTGCANSSGRGAALQFDGSLSLALDDARWIGLDLPANRSAVLIEGAGAGPSAPFGAGRMCLQAPRRRASYGMADAWGEVAFAPSLSSLSDASIGSTHHFQVLYRDPTGPCGASANLTNGLSLTLEP